MIFCLIWLLSYERSISNTFQVCRSIVAGRAVILVLLQRQKLSSGGSGCTLHTIVLCQRSSKNKHPIPSNKFELCAEKKAMLSKMLQYLAKKNKKFFSRRGSYKGSKKEDQNGCSSCQKPGHFIVDCPDLQKEKSKEKSKKPTFKSSRV